MLRLASYDIVFQEIPEEITLALNISGCPNRCPGCHSPHLWQEVGEPLTDDLLLSLISKYKGAISCLCFMGGDSSHGEIIRLSEIVKIRYSGRIKIAWYSGRSSLPENFPTGNFNFIKLGPYIAQKGGLRSPSTNQKMYRIEKGEMEDITHIFNK